MHCPVCEGLQCHGFQTVGDRVYLRCDRCLATFLHPEQRPGPAAELAEYQLHQNTAEDPNYRQFLRKLSDPLLARLPPTSVGLDFGCGPGPALATLLVFQLLGEALVLALGVPVPGPVVGLALLLLTLVLRPSVLGAIKPTAQTLLQHLSLLFVPAGVGVMLHLQRLGDEALAIGVALVVSTLVGLASAALTMAWLMKRTGR